MNDQVQPESIHTALIRARIQKIEQERDRFVQEANRQIAAFNGAIQALTALLAPEPEPAPENKTPPGPGTASSAE